MLLLRAVLWKGEVSKSGLHRTDDSVVRSEVKAVLECSLAVDQERESRSSENQI